MLTISTPPEQRVLLQNISWQLYESLLAELGNKRSTRIAYHQGQLEIMVPLAEHENRHRLIDRLIVTLIEELNLEYNPFGSMTIKKRKKAAGKEPDSCYYSGSQKSEVCPMPYALCPMPYALCPVVPHLSEKGYISRMKHWSEGEPN